MKKMRAVIASLLVCATLISFAGCARVKLIDDEDIDGMFDVYNRHHCLSGFQFLVQYEQQPSSTTNVEITIQSP